MSNLSLPIPLDVLVDQPCLTITQEESSITYSGPMIVNAKMYRISVKQYSNGDKTKFEFTDVDNSLEEKFPGILRKINTVDAGNVSSYLKIVSKIIESFKPSMKNYTSKYLKVILEFKEFSKFYIDLRNLELTPNLSSIKVSFVDEAIREHHLEFGVDYGETTDIFFYQEYDVPKDENCILKKKSSNLKELYNLFLTYVEELQPFFELMDMIDANCTVIDPKQPLKKFNYRRILLEKNFSVIITVDPCNVKCCPNFSFVGPDKLIDEYQLRLRENLEKWNDQEYIFEQLLLVLGLEEFPKECVIDVHDISTNLLISDSDCSICFSSDVEGSLPDIVCGNKHCVSVYHRLCLFQWLSSIDSRKYFNDIQGPCPNCEQIISCAIVT